MDPAFRFQGLPAVDPDALREQLEAQQLRSQVLFVGFGVVMYTLGGR